MFTAQSSGAEENADCISAEGYDFPDEYPGYDTKQTDGKALVSQLLGISCTL